MVGKDPALKNNRMLSCMNEDSIHCICISCEERRGTGGACTIGAMFLNCGTASRECILVDLRLDLLRAVAHEDGAARDAGTHLTAVALCSNFTQLKFQYLPVLSSQPYLWRYCIVMIICGGPRRISIKVNRCVIETRVEHGITAV